MIFFYKLISNVVFFFSPILIIIRLLKKKEDPKRFQEKFCFFSKKKFKNNLIWIHVASVGELVSIIPLIFRLEKNKNIDQILVTSVTTSSARLFEKLKFKKTIHQYFPLDTNFLTNKFIKYWKPTLAIFIESEIWPNMILNLKKNSIRHILLNARITKKTFNRWFRLKSFSKKIFQSFYKIYPQNTETKKYLERLSCEKISFIGNIKFTNYDDKIENGLNSKVLKNKVIWCASSTHKNEEYIVAKTHLRLKKKIKNLLTIIIPRHIDRKNEIIKIMNNLSLKTHIHSSKKKIDKNTEIYLVDTYGETKKFFKVSSIVFLGGSLIKHGGQNPLEAARFGSKILHGRYVSNFKEVYNLLKKNFQTRQIKSQKDMAYAVKSFLKYSNPSNRFINKLNNIGKKILIKTEFEINNLIK